MNATNKVNDSALLRRLDDVESEFLERLRRQMRSMIQLPAAHTETEVAHWQLPGTGRIAQMLTDWMKEAYALGQAHGDLLCRELQRKYGGHKLAEWQPSIYRLASIGYDPSEFWLTPTAAIKEFSRREIMLAGDVEGDIAREVKQVMLNYLHGTPISDTNAAVAALVEKNMNRAQLITTTETTYAYNRGRLTAYHGNDVDYVRFSAVMDRRTSEQCRSRHGKVMRMDSAQLPGNVPPLHGRCRSVLSPIFSRYQPGAVTPETTDWSGAAPLPKGWKTE